MVEPTIDVAMIWWRNVQLGEFYNIERYPRIEGGGGALYIEIPSSLVPDTLEFLDAENVRVEAFDPIVISARVVGDPEVRGTIEFRSKKGGRMRIANQNRQQPSSQRHPAWTAERGFPRAPDSVRSSGEARPYFPEGGLRIYIAKTFDGDYYAGFTKGPRPTTMPASDPHWELYPDSPRLVGSLIRA
jgi:hypothetical protein